MSFELLVYSALFFIFGSAIGSFLNVVIFRFEQGRVLTGRSSCPHCHHLLGVADLVPLFSFVFLQGKCRYCSRAISWQYPLVELSTAIIFALSYLWTGYRFMVVNSDSAGLAVLVSFVYLLFFACVLLVLSVFDLRHGIIPDKILLPATLVALVFSIVSAVLKSASVFGVVQLVGLDIITALGLAGFFLILILVTRGRGMGGGDLKLSIFIGLSLGWPLSLVGIILGFLTGAAVSVMLVLRGKKGFGQTIPFGPFLALGAYLAALFGSQILALYLKTLGF